MHGNTWCHTFQVNIIEKFVWISLERIMKAVTKIIVVTWIAYTAIDAIDTIGSRGELKIAQWIQGSTLQWTASYNEVASSYGILMGHSEHWWRRFLRQVSVSGVLERTNNYCIQGLYRVTPKGRETLLNSESFSIPNPDGCEAIEHSPNPERGLHPVTQNLMLHQKRSCVLVPEQETLALMDLKWSRHW